MTSSYSYTDALRQAQQEARKELERNREVTKELIAIPTVSIPIEEYTELLKRDAWLSSLEAAGVDNWEGISYAYEIHREDHPDSEEN
jgi:hypothetical protein